MPLLKLVLELKLTWQRPLVEVFPELVYGLGWNGSVTVIVIYL